LAAFSLLAAFVCSAANLLDAPIIPGTDGINPALIAEITAVTADASAIIAEIANDAFVVADVGDFMLEQSNPPGTPFPVVIFTVDGVTGNFGGL
jgi:hypothetical protein